MRFHETNSHAIPVHDFSPLEYRRNETDNQEIRNCIYGGSFNNLLKELDQFGPWRRLNKMRPNQTYRFAKQEIMLRFFAFCENRSSYEGHLAKFLNAYMHANQNAGLATIAAKRDLFTETTTYLDRAIFESQTPPKLSITVLEALLVGIGANVPAILAQPAAVAKNKYNQLIHDEAFSEAALREGLSKKLRVMNAQKKPSRSSPTESMIARSYMLSNLRALNRLFRRATSPKESLFYSKLAILELCGWIEESMDDVVLRCAGRSLQLSDNKAYVRKEVIRRTHGFEYDRHFREMLIKPVGLVNVERLEQRVDRQSKRN